MKFYYFEGDTREGPYSANELVELAHKGDITPMTMVEAGNRRVQALKIKCLFTSLTPDSVLPDDQKPVYPPQIEDRSHLRAKCFREAPRHRQNSLLQKSPL